MAEKTSPLDRLNYSGDLTPVINNLVTAYHLGGLTDFSVFEVGYEDCNVKISTDKGSYVAKMFAKDRTYAEINRYTTILEKVIAAEVNHPKITHTQSGDIVFSDSGIFLVLMEYLEATSFMELGRIPSVAELRAVVEQAATIHRVNYKPEYLFDSWAIPHIQKMYEKVQHYIAAEDLPLVQRVLDIFSKVPIDELPHALVHGDFTKANIMLGDNEKIYVLDFSVANWYPRIQELAVIAANLMHDDNDEISLRERTEMTAEVYSEFSPLSDLEKQQLYGYALAGAAMEFMGAHQEKYINGNNTVETDFWLQLGRDGLRRGLANG